MRMSKPEALQRLRSLIETEAPATGDRLPAERQLTAFIGCSRETLRSVLAILEAEGTIWRHVGQGTFRGRRPPGQPVRDNILLEATTPFDLMDARRLLEPPVAAAAATRRTDADIVLLYQRVTEGQNALDRAACERVDDAFHQTIAQVARNPVLIALLRHFSNTRCRAVWQREWDRTYRRVGVTEFTQVHSGHHRTIVDAIAAGDGAAAQRRMEHHLNAVGLAMGTRGN
jgi:DNA-binding FadR family transcriptional regulator